MPGIANYLIETTSFPPPGFGLECSGAIPDAAGGGKDGLACRRGLAPGPGQRVDAAGLGNLRPESS